MPLFLNTEGLELLNLAKEPQESGQNHSKNREADQSVCHKGKHM